MPLQHLLLKYKFLQSASECLCLVTIHNRLDLELFRFFFSYHDRFPFKRRQSTGFCGSHLKKKTGLSPLLRNTQRVISTFSAAGTFRGNDFPALTPSGITVSKRRPSAVEIRIRSPAFFPIFYVLRWRQVQILSA
jgi:hypothetical protein